MIERLIAICLIVLATAIYTVTSYAGFDGWGFTNWTLAGGTCKPVEQVPIAQYNYSSARFGNTTTGKTRHQLFTLTNTGKGTISGIQPVMSSATGGFRVYSTSGTTAPMSWKVGYAPIAAGDHANVVRMASNQFPTQRIPVSGTGVAATSYADIVTYWSMTNTTVDKSQTAITASLSNSTVSGGVLTTNNSGGAGAQLTGASMPFNGTSGRIGFYFTPPTFSTSIIWIWQPDANNKIFAQGSGSSELSMTYQAGGGTSKIFTTTGAGLASGAQHYLEFAWDNTGAGSYKMYVDGVQRGSTTGLSGTMAGAANLNLGRAGGSNMPGTYDQMIFSTSPTRDIYAIRDLTSFP